MAGVFPDLEKPVPLWAGGDAVTADLGAFEPPYDEADEPKLTAHVAPSRGDSASNLDPRRVYITIRTTTSPSAWRRR
jgi:hypothetical protein